MYITTYALQFRLFLFSPQKYFLIWLEHFVFPFSLDAILLFRIKIGRTGRLHQQQIVGEVNNWSLDYIVVDFIWSALIDGGGAPLI